MASDLLGMALDVLAELGRSDADGHSPHPVYSWLATPVAHVGMGMGSAQWSVTRSRACLLFALWVVKEVAFDLPGADFTLWTWADSAADLAFGALGFWIAANALRRARG